jgi:hypothetical protein
MKTEAPNFSGNYPLGGERLGPGWRAMWRALPEDGWVECAPFAHLLAGQTGLDPKTIAGLLWKAEKAGILTKSVVGPGNRRRAYYRVASKNLVA